MRKLALSFVFFAVACSTTPKSVDMIGVDSKPDQLQSVIDQHTKFFRKYDGLYETFRAHATLLTAATQIAILDKRAAFLQWDTKQLSDEREKSRQEMATQTTVFLQFYAPDTDYNDLNRYNTIWHVYLDVDGHRFEAKIRKAHGKPIEFQAIYPNYDRFSTAYDLTFNISSSDVARRGAKLVLASTLGEGAFVFPAEP